MRQMKPFTALRLSRWHRAVEMQITAARVRLLSPDMAANRVNTAALTANELHTLTIDEAAVIALRSWSNPRWHR